MRALSRPLLRDGGSDVTAIFLIGFGASGVGSGSNTPEGFRGCLGTIQLIPGLSVRDDVASVAVFDVFVHAGVDVELMVSCTSTS